MVDITVSIRRRPVFGQRGWGEGGVDRRWENGGREWAYVSVVSAFEVWIGARGFSWLYG